MEAADRLKYPRPSVVEAGAGVEQRMRRQWKRWRHGETLVLEAEGALYACSLERAGEPFWSSQQEAALV